MNKPDNSTLIRDVIIAVILEMTSYAVIFASLGAVLGKQ